MKTIALAQKDGPASLSRWRMHTGATAQSRVLPLIMRLGP